jgi:uncharacterized protein|tara:strand:+ start:263 stop:988 length:726 start_codon:yes stop_codon:yes gene_type:complete
MTLSEILPLLPIIIIFSIIQSILGVGLLLFGTPTLLLMNYSYTETLWVLLPCSVAISLTQIINNYGLIESKKNAILFIVPAMVISLTIVIVFENSIDISKVVGFFLLYTGVIKFSKRAQHYLFNLMKKHFQLYYLLIGFIHGVSNMGGGPLSIFMSIVHSNKRQVQTNIAFIYLILASIQLIVLFILDADNVKYFSFVLVSITLLVYLGTSRFLTNKVNDRKYMLMINTLILIYGFLAIIK